jgi:glucose-1-phosphate adenylyltransferase
MDLLKRDTALSLFDDLWKIYSVSPVRPAQYIGKDAVVKNSLIVEGCTVNGTVENSILFEGVSVGKNTVIRDSVIMTDAKIGDNVVIEKAIIGSEAIIRRECKIGNGKRIAVIASKEEIKSGTVLEAVEL